MALSAASSFSSLGVSRRTARAGWWLSGGIVVGALALAYRSVGGPALSAGLLQQTMRDGEFTPGIHWQGHVLHVLWFQFACGALAGALGLRPRGTWLWWLAFIGVSTAYGWDFRVLTDPRLTGHAAREILTHGLITLPLAAGVLAWFSRDWKPGPRLFPGVGSRAWIVAAAGAALIPAGLLAAMAGQPVAAVAQTGAWDALVAAHAFEHGLDYVAVTALALAGTSLFSPVQRRSPGQPS